VLAFEVKLGTRGYLSLRNTDNGVRDLDYDIIVAGGGPAGMTAAIYSGRAGWKTVLFDPMGGGGQAGTTDMVYNYPGFPDGVSGPELMELMANQARAFGVKIEYEEVQKVVHSDADAGFKVDVGHEVHGARAVIYASGTLPRKLGVPGEEKYLAKGISFCATCDGALFRDKVVAVVGGGDSALTEAVFLTKFAKEVLLIHRRDEFRAGLATVKRVETNPKIKMLLSSVVESVRGEEVLTGVSVRDLKTGETRDLDVQGLFLYVGWSPNVEPVRHLVETDEYGYVITNEDMSTKTPGLFVAGDVRRKPLRQITTAVGDGATAAWSAEKYLLERG
jgi:thioredoxin reductase (NADPH)